MCGKVRTYPLNFKLFCVLFLRTTQKLKSIPSFLFNIQSSTWRGVVTNISIVIVRKSHHDYSCYANTIASSSSTSTLSLARLWCILCEEAFSTSLKGAEPICQMDLLFLGAAFQVIHLTGCVCERGRRLGVKTIQIHETCFISLSKMYWILLHNYSTVRLCKFDTF